MNISLFHQNSATYWEGNSEAETLQRVYGISFPDTKLMKDWEKFQEEAAKRDHRKIGRVSFCFNVTLKINFETFSIYNTSKWIRIF